MEFLHVILSSWMTPDFFNCVPINMNYCWEWFCLSCLAKGHTKDKSLICQFSFLYTLLKWYTREYLLAKRLHPSPAIGGFTAHKLVFLASLQNSFVERRDMSLLQVILRKWHRSSKGKCESSPSLSVESFKNSSIPSDVIGIVTLGIDTTKAITDVWVLLTVVPNSYNVIALPRCLCGSSMNEVLQTHSCASYVDGSPRSDQLFLCMVLFTGCSSVS